MRNRAKQREAYKMRQQIQQRPAKIEKPWLNAEGYYDPTAYLALRIIERKEKQSKRKSES